MKLGQQTKYPHLFLPTCWGHLTNSDGDSFKETNDLAVENRNLFAEQYSLKERCRKLPRYVVKQAGAGFDPGYGIFDHFESYRDTDGNFVVLVSPSSR